jgi:glucose/arabinose dehydrogenase
LAAQPKPGRFRDPTRQSYEQFCASCHGVNLAGGQAQSLIDDTWVFGGDEASLTKSIRDGRPGTLMPAFKGGLTDVQIRALVVYVREQAARARGKPPTNPNPAGMTVESERHTFRFEVVAEGLETPWGIAFLPDGRMLVTERPGRLRTVESGTLAPQPIAGTPSVWSQQDGGLFDVEVHPDYARNGWIYLSYAEPGADKSSMTAIVRGRLKDGRWVDQETLYRAPPELYFASNIHYGSRFLFDRQGRLYYTIGDRGREQDAQELSKPHGKIHRVADDGGVPRDNPFAHRPGALGSIWSYGHRNPQGLAFHPVTGKLWATEHGPRGGDELNRIEAGRNYGWPVITHGLHYDGTAITATTARRGMEQPIVHWTPSIAPSAIAFYTGDRFPGWTNDLFVTALTGEALRRLVTKGDRVVHQEVLFRGFGRVRDVVTGPDGYLYVALAVPGASVAATTPGRIVRLVPR